MPFDGQLNPHPDRHELTRHGHQLLTLARIRLAEPGVWCQGYEETVAPDAPGGLQYCSRGIIRHLSAQLGFVAVEAYAALSDEILHECRCCTHENRIANMNDQRGMTLDGILSWFDRAIARLERDLVPYPLTAV